jgi:hypothetical protein
VALERISGGSSDWHESDQYAAQEGTKMRRWNGFGEGLLGIGIAMVGKSGLDPGAGGPFWCALGFVLMLLGVVLMIVNRKR